MVMSTKEMQATVGDRGDARRLDQAEPPTAASRNAGLDALRANLTPRRHSSRGHHLRGEVSWFYVEIKPSGAPSSIILTLFSAYPIYIIHPPILVGVALAMRSFAAPSLMKFALAGSAASALCFVAAGALLTSPMVRRIA
jgi:hypothetical protein